MEKKILCFVEKKSMKLSKIYNFNLLEKNPSNLLYFEIHIIKESPKKDQSINTRDSMNKMKI